jgi:lipoprotein-anchoring transpeptidase ErfK/SrfK
MWPAAVDTGWPAMASTVPSPSVGSPAQPGPNGPVGTVWIALSKPTYGIHGTPEPSKIGKTQSHGCVRLTNWDATELAKMVSVGTTVEFLD